MSDLVNIRVRLHLPFAKVGEVIAVDAERAERLVAAKYATFSDDQPQRKVDVPVATSDVVASGAAGKAIVELPPQSAVKAEWEAVAQSLGIDTEELTKAEIIEAVEQVAGH